MYLELWHQSFKDDDYNLVALAIQFIINVDTRENAPNIAQVREAMRKISSEEIDDMTEQEAWAIVYDRLKDSNYYSEREFNKLPPSIKKVVGSPQVLREWSIADSKELNTIIASNFMRSYRNRMAYEKESRSIPKELNYKIDKYLDFNKAKEIDFTSNSNLDDDQDDNQD